MSDDLSLSEDAFIFGDGVMEKKETVTLEKKVYDILLKNNADLMDEKALAALEKPKKEPPPSELGSSREQRNLQRPADFF